MYYQDFGHLFEGNKRILQQMRSGVRYVFAASDPKLKKKHLLIIVALLMVMVISMAACGGNQKPVDIFMEGLEEGDYKAIQNIVAPGCLGDINRGMNIIQAVGGGYRWTYSVTNVQKMDSYELADMIDTFLYEYSNLKVSTGYIVLVDVIAYDQNANGTPVFSTQWEFTTATLDGRPYVVSLAGEPFNVSEISAQAAPNPSQGGSDTNSSTVNNARVGGYGSTFSNAMNGGYFASEEGWLYYSVEDALFKSRMGGTERTILDDNCDSPLYGPSLNVLDGWVYFWNDEGDGTISLYKMRTSGAAKTKLADQNNKYSWYVPETRVVSNWIFYSEIYFANIGGVEDFALARIVRMDMDGTQKKIVAENLYPYVDQYVYFDIVEGELYYSHVDIELLENRITSGTDTNSENLLLISKCETDGNAQVILYGNAHAFNFVIDDGWLYFIDENDYCMKMTLDGLQSMEVTDSDWGLTDNAFLFINDDLVYYNDSFEIYSLGMSSGREAALTEGLCRHVCVIDGWFYYEWQKDREAWSYEIRRTKIDGSITEVIHN